MKIPELVYEIRNLARKEEDPSKKDLFYQCAKSLEILGNIAKIADLAVAEHKAADSPAVNEDETIKWNVDDVFNKREEFESAIIVECNKRVSKWFTISQLRTNIVPPQALQNSIIEKTKAIQEVQVAENQKRVAEAEAQRKIAVAKGDSAELIIRALAEAQSTKIKQQQLTPMYLEYMKLTKWDGQLPSTVLGNSNGVMVNVK